MGSVPVWTSKTVTLAQSGLENRKLNISDIEGESYRVALPKHITAMWKSNDHMLKHVFFKSVSVTKVDKTQNRVRGNMLTDGRDRER